MKWIVIYLCHEVCGAHTTTAAAAANITTQTTAIATAAIIAVFCRDEFSSDLRMSWGLAWLFSHSVRCGWHSCCPASCWHLGYCILAWCRCCLVSQKHLHCYLNYYYYYSYNYYYRGTAASWVEKAGGPDSCNFPTVTTNFPQNSDTSNFQQCAQNFNFAIKFP